MAGKHKPLSTLALNAAARKIRARTNGAPQNVALLALIVSSLVSRWRQSDKPEDQHLLRSVEQIAIYEDWLTSEGGDVWKELEKPKNGLFGPSMFLLAMDRPFMKRKRKEPAHDVEIFRFQYDQLWGFLKQHPLPVSRREWGTWLSTHWASIDKYVLRWAPCHCQYRAFEDGPPDISECAALEEVLLTTMAHIHDSTPGTIDKQMKPSHGKPKSQLPRSKTSRTPSRKN